MENWISLIKQKKITDKDLTVLVFIELYPLKNARDISTITGKNYSRLTESLNRLERYNLILSTNERPKKYMKNE